MIKYPVYGEHTCLYWFHQGHPHPGHPSAHHNFLSAPLGIYSTGQLLERREDSLMAKILVLDDVLDAVMMIQRVLQKKGHEIFTFTEEEEALDFARSTAVDLAILDIKLKKISGIEVLQELKKIRPSMRAIMLTGYPTLETAQESLVLGAGEYCVKPVDIEELEEKVEKVLSD